MVHRAYRLPSGQTVRPQSQRRYVLVRESGYIVYRTDVLERAQLRSERASDCIIDQERGLVRIKALRWAASSTMVQS